MITETPQMGKGAHPPQPGAWQIDGMFIGGHRSGEWVVLSQRENSSHWGPYLWHPLSSVALFGSRETLRAALPHLGPNAHCEIVLASGSQTGCVWGVRWQSEGYGSIWQRTSGDGLRVGLVIGLDGWMVEWCVGVRLRGCRHLCLKCKQNWLQ